MRGKVVGVLISVRDWNERFTAKAAAEERRKLVAEILAERVTIPEPSLDAVLEEMRGS
jgi:hypothetical protein